MMPFQRVFSKLHRGGRQNIKYCSFWFPHIPQSAPLNIFFKDFIYLFLETGEGREKERERNISVWLPLMHPQWGPGHNPGMCPDWELNLQPSGSQVSAQSTEPHQPRQPTLVFDPNISQYYLGIL